MQTNWVTFGKQKGQDMKCAICEEESQIRLCRKCQSEMQALIEEGIPRIFTSTEQAFNAERAIGIALVEWMTTEDSIYEAFEAVNKLHLIQDRLGIDLLGMLKPKPEEDKEPETFANQYDSLDTAIRGLASSISDFGDAMVFVQMLSHNNVWEEIDSRKALLLLEENILHTFRYTPGV